MRMSGELYSFPLLERAARRIGFAAQLTYPQAGVADERGALAPWEPLGLLALNRRRPRRERFGGRTRRRQAMACDGAPHAS